MKNQLPGFLSDAVEEKSFHHKEVVSKRDGNVYFEEILFDFNGFSTSLHIQNIMFGI